MRYNNYHKHDDYGNPWVIDTIAKPEEYCKRAHELGHTTVFTTNHGMQGNIFAWMEASKPYNLKICMGLEAYYVNDRHEKDRSNKHLIIIARNNNGARQINEMVSESHEHGFYYRPRVDRELVFSLNPDDVIITSACIAGIWNQPELLLQFKNRFKDHFFLEIQNHDMPAQIEANKTLLEFSRQSGIQLIHGNDSHYIYPEDAKYRDIFLKGKGKDFGYEEELILDYPDSDTIFQRYEKQGVVPKELVKQALENTLVFDDCSPLTIINDEIKLPSVSDTPTEDLRKIINDGWAKERKNIPREKWPEYLKAIREEVKVVEDTHMENYFLIDYNIAKFGQEKYGGRLTNTGRGSAPSFYITKLLGLTDIDRISAPITLFPSRFMSVERILGARSLPDIDLNTTDRVPFIKATEDLLGKENCAWMLAWKPLQDASAFRLYCKGIGMHISEYNDVAMDLDTYRDVAKWKPIIEESKRFVGVIESVSESPCSDLLYDKPVRREIGLVRTKSDKNGGVTMCCLLDGYNCDKYKYLKNDYLTVTVWAIIRDVCNLAGIPIPTIRELDSLMDDKTFDIYKNGLTSTINQADSQFATQMAMIFQPKNVAEVSAFVAIIRPGCASLLQDFVHRRPYTTGVKELDDLLIEGNHRMIYQELIMKYLIWLGIPETGSYDIIKKIAKKKFKEQELKELKIQLENGWIKRVGSSNGFDETWIVVEQAARYSFNASHSLSYAYDSLYGAYLKSHYPLEYYTVVFNYYSDDEERTTRLTSELKCFDIKLQSIKFRHSKGTYSMDKNTNTIYKGLQSVKYMNAQVADEMYELRNNQYADFVDLYFDLMDKTSINSKQMKNLIGLNFFSEFGCVSYLMELYDVLEKNAGKKQISKSKIQECGIPEKIIRKYATETKCLYKIDDMRAVLKDCANELDYKDNSILIEAKFQIECLGYITVQDETMRGMAIVENVDAKFNTPKLILYSLKNGKSMTCKISKAKFKKSGIVKGSVVQISKCDQKPKYMKDGNGEWYKSKTETELWVTELEKVS